MKKTLFLTALAMLVSGGALADIMDGVMQTSEGTWVSTTVNINGSNINNYLQDGTFTGQPQSHLSIGTSTAKGEVNIEGNGEGGAPVVVGIANAVFIGSPGYAYAYRDDNVANDGLLTISNGAEFRVAISTPYFAGAHLYIGSSDTKSQGIVKVDNATLHSNAVLVVGGGKSHGELLLTNGANVIVEPTANLTDTGYVEFTVGKGATSSGVVTLDGGSKLTVGSCPGKTVYTTLGDKGDATVTVSGGSVLDLSAASQSYLGAYAGSSATVNVTGEGSILELSSNLSVLGFYGTAEVTVRDGGNILAQGVTYLGYVGEGTLTVKDGGTLTNTGTIRADQNGEAHLIVGEGGIVDNYAYICLNEDLVLNTGSQLYTGMMFIRGQDDLGAAVITPASEIDFQTGIIFNDEDNHVRIADGAKDVVVGTHLTSYDGKDQHLSAEDMAVINAQVLSGLGLDAGDAKVSNVVGAHIMSEYKVAEDAIISVGGGTVDINSDSAAEAIDGTIGSFIIKISETDANVRVSEVDTGSTINWGGGNLKTTDTDKTTLLTQGTTVNVSAEGSKLVVVDNTSLQNEGTVNSDVEVEAAGLLNNHGTISGDVKVDGAMKGTGTVEGKVTVSEDALLIVGNSPGLASFDRLDIAGQVAFCIAGETPADADHAGWAAGVHSQLHLTAGSLTLTETAVISIQLGGDGMLTKWMDKDYEFDFTLVTGITSLDICGETITSGTLTASAVEKLKGMTDFSITAEALGLASFDTTGIEMTPADYTYALESDGNGKYALHLKGSITVPEPATATLSLLALAALAARRRRKR